MKTIVRSVPLIALTIVLLVLGLKSDPVPQTFDQQDKLHHLLGFAALGFAATLTFPRLPAWRVLLGCAAVGLVIELGQSLEPLRTASLGDMTANTVGVLLGWACTWPLLGWLRPRQLPDRS